MVSLVTVYLALITLCHSKGLGRFARVTIDHPNSPTPFLGFVSAYNLDTSTPDEPLQGKLIYHPSDATGCTEWTSIKSSSSSNTDTDTLSIGTVDRGTCSFLEKSKQAHLAGLDLLIIVSENEILDPMSADEKELTEFKASQSIQDVILTIMVPQSFKVFMQTPANKDTVVTVTRYNSKLWDSAMLVMIGASTFLVGLGAWYSSDTERAKMYSSSTGNLRGKLRRRAAIQEIDGRMAWGFVIVASTGLLTLYFFVSKIFILIVIIFCIGSMNGLSTIFAHTIDHFIPNFQTIEYYLKSIDLRFTLSDLLGFIPAAIISMAWFLSRRLDFAWILQNIMCVGLLLTLQRNIRLTNIKIATILLSMAFFYDIFWVFISPLFFESSVMVAVATYHHGGHEKDTLPVVLKFPRLDDVFHSPMILGLGDIALPGLFVSYLLRYDYLSKVGIDLKKGYFLPALIGYAVGMMLTDINLILMQHGQPALLFLVPCTLATTMVLAYRRGHLRSLWNGNKAVRSKRNAANVESAEYLLK